MPLVHDRDIDGPRAGRDKARLDRAIAEPTIVRTRLDFMRDAAGKPLLPARRRMQPLPEPVPLSISFYEAALARALGARPEFQRLSLEREKLFVERRLAVNQTLPGIDAQVFGNQDAGFGKSGLSGIDGLEFTFDSVRAGPRPVPGPAGR